MKRQSNLPRENKNITQKLEDEFRRHSIDMAAFAITYLGLCDLNLLPLNSKI